MARHPAKAVTVPGARANAGLQSLYRRKLETLVAEMHADTMATVREAWRSTNLAHDESPAQTMAAARPRMATPPARAARAAMGSRKSWSISRQ